MNKLQAIRLAFAKSAPLPFSWRLHQTVRALLAPFEKLVDYLPEAGTLVDVGCGHGLFLLLAKQAHPHLQLAGFDLSSSKVHAAHKLLSQQNLDVDLRVGDVAELPRESVEAISIIDVLYLVPTARWPEVIARCYAKLRPGGTLLLKEMDPSARWKLSLLRCEEWLAVRVFGWTLGHEFSFPTSHEVERMLEEAGFAVESVPLHARSFAPHHLWFATKPKSSS